MRNSGSADCWVARTALRTRTTTMPARATSNTSPEPENDKRSSAESEDENEEEEYEIEEIIDAKRGYFPGVRVEIIAWTRLLAPDVAHGPFTGLIIIFRVALATM